jgi:hypothetical protein
MQKRREAERQKERAEALDLFLREMELPPVRGDRALRSRVWGEVAASLLDERVSLQA